MMQRDDLSEGRDWAETRTLRARAADRGQVESTACAALGPRLNSWASLIKHQAALSDVCA
jgi:hypothetical protein